MNRFIYNQKKVRVLRAQPRWAARVSPQRRMSRSPRELCDGGIRDGGSKSYLIFPEFWPCWCAGDRYSMKQLLNSWSQQKRSTLGLKGEDDHPGIKCSLQGSWRPSDCHTEVTLHVSNNVTTTRCGLVATGLTMMFFEEPKTASQEGSVVFRESLDHHANDAVCGSWAG